MSPIIYRISDDFICPTGAASPHIGSCSGKLSCGPNSAHCHVGLDEFTHDWGWPAHHLSWYTATITSDRWFGREWTVFRVVQYIGHVGLSVLCIWFLWNGTARWMAARAARITPFTTTKCTYVIVWGGVVAGLIAAAVWVHADRNGSAPTSFASSPALSPA